MRFSGDWENLLEQFEGIQRMLEQEADYEQEAELQGEARACLSGLDDVVVPEVVPELSTRRVLTMEYVDGLLLEPFLATSPSQELRDRHGAQISRAVFRLWYGGRTVYADPHPGNFLFMPDGRLGLIDFGCCHRFRDDEFEYVMSVEQAAWSGDEDEQATALAHGCALDVADLKGERLALMLAYSDWLWQPLRTDGPFDFGTPGHFEQGMRLYGEFIKRRWTRSQPINVWLNKAFFGVRAMLTHLEARVEYKRIMQEESPL
jgi:hypothetical protein